MDRRQLRAAVVGRGAAAPGVLPRHDVARDRRPDLRRDVLRALAGLRGEGSLGVRSGLGRDVGRRDRARRGAGGVAADAAVAGAVRFGGRQDDRRREHGAEGGPGRVRHPRGVGDRGRPGGAGRRDGGLSVGGGARRRSGGPRQSAERGGDRPPLLAEQLGAAPRRAAAAAGAVDIPGRRRERARPRRRRSRRGSRSCSRAGSTRRR